MNPIRNAAALSADLGTALLGITLLASSGAQAGTLSMQGWYHGAGNTVKVNNPGYQGQAGGFKAKLSGMSDSRFNLDALEAYCVDLLQPIELNKSYSAMLQGDAGSASFVIKPIDEVFDATRVERLTALVSYVGLNPTLVSNAAQSTSLQLAIWNILYDSDNTLNAYTGAQFSDTSSYRHLAGDLLTQSVGHQSNRQLFVMSSASQQDLLFWVEGQRVPAPAGLTLASTALALLWLGQRRRRQQPAP